MRKRLAICVIALGMLAASCAGASAGSTGAQTSESEPDPTAEPVQQPTAEPVPQPTAEPVQQPTAEPVPQPTAEPDPTADTVPSVACQRLTAFDGPDPAAGWFIVNDGVMGGRSSAAAVVTGEVLRFGGDLVTAGGGFSSVRLALPLGGLGEGATELRLRVRTDGRRYEVVAEDALPGRDRRVSHYGPVAPAAAGEWAEVSVDLAAMEPRLFGRPVVDAPLEPTATTSVGLFLADGVDGAFAVELDWIDVCGPPATL